ACWPTRSRRAVNNSNSRWAARVRRRRMHPSRSFRAGVTKRSSLAGAGGGGGQGVDLLAGNGGLVCAGGGVRIRGGGRAGEEIALSRFGGRHQNELLAAHPTHGAVARGLRC
ncbi:MAG: hypothetical protein ACK6BG_11125, partial [Cyanobacteriota bacterium]